FFYAPKILGGRDSIKAVGGEGAVRVSEVLQLNQIEWKKLGPDLMLTARVASRSYRGHPVGSQARRLTYLDYVHRHR
ncbi:MAG: hypothetical protein ACXWC8_08890, partial [Limisphaerales bacterium]